MSASSYSGVVNRNAFLTRSTASTSANGAAQAIAVAGTPKTRRGRTSSAAAG